MEAALTLPLAVFMVLGTLQLFMMLQARLLTEHAAFTATRAGSLSQGSCKRMMDAALVSVLPAVTRTNSPAALRRAYRRYRGNRYVAGLDDGRDGPLIWIFRQLGERGPGGRDDPQFDDPDRPNQLDRTRLRTRVVFWFPMRIPFANWVMARSFLAMWGLGDYTAANPLLQTQTASWNKERDPPGYFGSSLVFPEFTARTLGGEYVFPITATSAMRMMTPAMNRQGFFDKLNCGVP